MLLYQWFIWYNEDSKIKKCPCDAQTSIGVTNTKLKGDVDVVNFNTDKEVKQCTKCGLEKPITDKYFEKSNKEGHLRNECIECRKEYRRRYYKEYNKRNINQVRKRNREYSKIYDEQERAERRSNFVSTVQKCANCKDRYTTEYERRHSEHCSLECSVSYSRRKAKIKRRARIRLNGKPDMDITLDRLIQRDEGKCYICGTHVDEHDFRYNADGYFIAGKSYPSIDHVLAIVNGGHHSWSNIKLAHHYCNTIKRDNLIENKHDKAPV